MIQWTATIKRFGQQGEKTGWTYIDIPAATAEKLVPGNRKGFRVKGLMDDHSFAQLPLLPMGGGDFIITLNAALRKKIGKGKGDTVRLKLEVDATELQLPPDLMACLEDEPEALQFFISLTPGHRAYFGKWIDSAKTDPTRTRRIAMTVDAMLKQWDYGMMIRNASAKREVRK